MKRILFIVISAGVFGSALPVSAAEENAGTKIIKQGLLGAGAVAVPAAVPVPPKLQPPASVQQPVIVEPPRAPQPVYAPQVPSALPTPLTKKILRKYDKDGKVISEEEVWE